MKNVIIYNKVPTAKFGGQKNDDVIKYYLETQIDNSIFYGWDINDIIIATNFDFEYKGIKNIKLNDVCEFSGYNNKWYGLRELYNNHFNEDCWIHDYDNWQISVIDKFPNFTGKIGGCTYVYNNEWNTASMFIKKDSHNILDYVYEFLLQNKHIPFDSDENAISYIRNVNEVKSYFSDLNQKYNVGLTQLEKRYESAEKPVCVLGCKIFNNNEYEKFKFKYGNLDLIPSHLIDMIENRKIVMKKIFVITTHCSNEYCEYGNYYLYNCLDSLYEIKPDKVIIVDNQSSIKPNLDRFKDLNIDYIYIENQKERGLTGAWNVGINAAIQYGPALICNTNNDVEFDLSYNNLYNHIVQDKDSSITIYGAKTNNPGWQVAQSVLDRDTHIMSGKNSNVLNGFCLFFTNDFYSKYQENDLLFSNEKEYPWGGQECIMTHWSETKKVCIKVLNNCFVYHKKEASWRKVSK